MKENVILQHIGVAEILCFDFLSVQKKKKCNIVDYQMQDCKHVQKFLKDHPKYHYVGSTDLGHIAIVNIAIERAIMRLVNRGWQVIEVTESA